MTTPEALFGVVPFGRVDFGAARRGAAGPGTARQEQGVESGAARRGEARLGRAGQGLARQGLELGKARWARCGWARLGVARQGMECGAAWFGVAGRGGARHGTWAGTSARTTNQQQPNGNNTQQSTHGLCGPIIRRIHARMRRHRLARQATAFLGGLRLQPKQQAQSRSVGRCGSRGDQDRDGGARWAVMSTDEPKPRCCSECWYFSRKTVDVGRCEAPMPWFVDPYYTIKKIHLPETLADACDCFTQNPTWAPTT